MLLLDLLREHAGWTEIGQVAVAAIGFTWQRRVLRAVRRDAMAAYSELEHMAASEHVQDERTRTRIQLALLLFGLVTLVVPPPPPDRFSQMMTLDPRGVAWTLQHITLIYISVKTAMRSKRARRGRRAILQRMKEIDDATATHP